MARPRRALFAHARIERPRRFAERAPRRFGASAVHSTVSFESLESRSMLAGWYPTYTGGLIGPIQPPANTPVGAFGENCGSPFFSALAGDSPPAPAAAPPVGPPAFGPPVELFVTVTDDEDDGDRSIDDLSLREAVLIANEADAEVTIHVAAGVYMLTRPGRGENTSMIGDLDLLGTEGLVRIVGADRATTVIRGAEDDRIFHVHPGVAVEISHVTIEEGLENLGGGIFNSGLLTLSDVIVQYNVVGEQGGGVYNSAGSTLIVEDSIIASNAADFGGGVFSAPNGRVTLTNVIVSDNQSDAGGGVFNHGGLVEITGGEVRLNSANESGGGLINLSTATAAIMRLESGDVHLNRVITQPLRPQLAQGGGICNAAQGGAAFAQMVLNNTQVTSNSAIAGDGGAVVTSAAQGGGLYNHAVGGDAIAVVFADESTFSANAASASGVADIEAAGGGIYNRADDGEASASLNVSNSSISSNSALVLVTADEGPAKGIAQGGGLYNRARTGTSVATASLAFTAVNNNAVLANASSAATVQAAGGGIYNTSGVSSTPFNATANLFVTGGEIKTNQVNANDGSSTLAIGGGVANSTDYGITVVDFMATNIAANQVDADSSNSPSANGGGIYNRVSPLSGRSRFSLVESSVRDNLLNASGFVEPSPFGGGIYTDGVATTIRDSTLSGNQTGPGGSGGGIFARRSLSIVNSTISTNHATFGGGMFAEIATLALKNVSVAMNRADAGGGGLFVVPGTSAMLGNSIVATNYVDFGLGPTPDDLFGPVAAGSDFNWIGACDGATGIADGVAGNHVGTSANPIDPMLGPLASNGGPTQTHLVMFGSPVIDQGSPGFNPNDFSPALSLDQREEDRVVDGNSDFEPRVDIGAVEFSPSLYGDLNGDDVVDLLDLMTIQRNFDLAGPRTYFQGDLNHDALVDAADVAILLHNYGATLAPPSPPAGSSPKAPAAAVVGVRAASAGPTSVAYFPEIRTEPKSHVIRAISRRIHEVAVDRALSDAEPPLAARRETVLHARTRREVN